MLNMHEFETEFVYLSWPSFKFRAQNGREFVFHQNFIRHEPENRLRVALFPPRIYHDLSPVRFRG